MPKILQPAGIRWRADVGFEIICPSCARQGDGAYYWPLTEEFWNWKKTLTKCRACLKEEDRAKARKRWKKSEKYRAYRRKYLEEYRKVAGDAIKLRQNMWRESMKADPVRYEEHKRKQREASARWREKKKAEKLMADAALIQLQEAAA